MVKTKGKDKVAPCIGNKQCVQCVCELSGSWLVCVRVGLYTICPLPFQIQLLYSFTKSVYRLYTIITELIIVTCVRRRLGRDSVTWCCLHGLSRVLSYHEVQRNNASTTDRHHRQGLENCMGHRRLWANVSCIYCWCGWVCLASLLWWWGYKALAV